MAQFNPQIQDTNDPNWLGWSRPISDPKPDTSTAASIEMVSDAASGGLKLADYTYKSVIDDQVHAMVDQERNKYTSDLEKTDITTRIAAAAKTGKSVSEVLPTDQSTEVSSQSAPRDLQNLPNKLETLDSARGNGKLSETAYDGRLVTLAKDLRSRYPGYRDYIDQEFKRVSGRDSANQYIKGLLGDINSFVNAGKEEHNKWRNEIITATKDGIPGGPQMLEQFEAGKVSGTDILKWIAPVKTMQLQWSLNKDRWANEQVTDAERSKDVTDGVNKLLYGISGNHFNSLQILSGTTTPAKVQDIITEASTGKREVTDLQAQQLGKVVESYKVAAFNEAWAKVNEVGANGRPVLSYLGGPDKAKALINEHLSKYDNLSKLIYDKNFGAAFNAMNTIRAMGDQDKQTLLTDKDMGESLRMGQALTGMGDQYNRQFFQHMLATSGVPEKAQEWFKSKTLGMTTQPDLRDGGNVRTLKQAITDGQTKKIDSPKTYDALVSHVEDIGKKDTPDAVKINLAKAVFSPEGLGLMTKFEREGYDPSTGRSKPGDYSIYRRLTKPDITSSLFALSKSSEEGRQTWDNYKSWAKQTLGRELLGPTLKDLSNVMDNPDVKFGWDDKANRLTPPTVTGPPSMQRDNYKNYLDREFKKINTSLFNLSEIAKAEGSDVSTYLLDVLKEHGVDVGKLPGVPQRILKGIIASRADQENLGKKYKVPEDNAGIRDSRLPYDQELPTNAQRGSLSEFLSAPASTLPSRRNNAPVSPVAAPRGIPRAVEGPIMGVERTGSPNEDFGKINPAYSR